VPYPSCRRALSGNACNLSLLTVGIPGVGGDFPIIPIFAKNKQVFARNCLGLVSLGFKGPRTNVTRCVWSERSDNCAREHHVTDRLGGRLPECFDRRAALCHRGTRWKEDSVFCVKSRNASSICFVEGVHPALIECLRYSPVLRNRGRV